MVFFLLILYLSLWLSFLFEFDVLTNVSHRNSPIHHFNDDSSHCDDLFCCISNSGTAIYAFLWLRRARWLVFFRAIQSNVLNMWECIRQTHVFLVFIDFMENGNFIRRIISIFNRDLDFGVISKNHNRCQHFRFMVTGNRGQKLKFNSFGNECQTFFLFVLDAKRKRSIEIFSERMKAVTLRRARFDSDNEQKKCVFWLVNQSF